MTTTPALLTIREWNQKRGILMSVGSGHSVWPTAEVFADELPTDINGSGIYSVLPERFEKGNYGSPVAGLVANRGQIQIHADGTVRSQSAEIVRLFVNRRHVSVRQCIDLRDRYQVAIVYTDDIPQSVQKWLDQNHALIEAQKGLAEAYRCEPDDLSGEQGITVEHHVPRAFRLPKSLFVSMLYLFLVAGAALATAVVFLNFRPQQGTMAYQSTLSASAVAEVVNASKYWQASAYASDNGSTVLLQEKTQSWWTHWNKATSELGTLKEAAHLEPMEVK